MPLSAAPTPSAKDGPPRLPRCPACQLQLCKSRAERPHGALQETGRDEAAQAVIYACQTCGAVLVRSADPSRAGWLHRR